MSQDKMAITVMATQIAEAVAKDETPEEGGCDISAGLFGPNLSELITEWAPKIVNDKDQLLAKIYKKDLPDDFTAIEIKLINGVPVATFS